MASEAVFVWHGGSRLLEGKQVPPGTVLPAEQVDRLRTKDALLSMGVIRVEMRELAPKKAAPSSTTKKSTASKKTTKKTTTRKTTKKEE